MKFDVIIEEPAYFDLENIFDFIAADSPYMAEKVLDDLIDATEKLCLFPKRHPVILKLREMEVRQLVFKKGFRILYVITETKIHILHCFRCEQDLTENIF